MDELRKAYRINVIIGLAIMVSLVLYLVIVALIEGESLPMTAEEPLSGSSYEMLQFTLLGVSVAIFFVIRMAARILMGPREHEGKPARQQPALRLGNGTAIGHLTTVSVITYALCEVPAIFGLVLYFLGRRVTDFYLFLLISFFYFATYFPRYSQWEEWYRKQQGPGQGPGRS